MVVLLLLKGATMITIFPLARIFLHGPLVDFRNGFDGLFFLATLSFKDLAPNTYFVFFNPRRTRIKVLYYGGDNISIWYMRLQKGVFCPPCGFKSGQITLHELRLILQKTPPSWLLNN